MTAPQRFTPEYLEEQKRLHAQPRGYGGRGDKWAETVDKIAKAIGLAPMAMPGWILDYGCGQNSLAVELGRMGWRTRSYDPAIPNFDVPPTEPSDLVVCTDVLEHVEEDCVPAVLEHLAELTGRELFVVISLVETSKTLSDGRQAHITLKNPSWWLTKILAADFKLVKVMKGNKPEKEFVARFRKRTAP